MSKLKHNIYSDLNVLFYDFTYFYVAFYVH